MASQHQYFYPAASFPANNEKVRWDAGGSLVPDLGDPKPNEKEEVPEVKPQKPILIDSVSVPVATPASASSITSSQVSQGSASTGTGVDGGGSDVTPGGITSISSAEAIALDAERKANHPDGAALTTGTFSASLPEINESPMTPHVPSVPANTASTMATKPAPTSVKVADTITDPTAVKKP